MLVLFTIGDCKPRLKRGSKDKRIVITHGPEALRNGRTGAPIKLTKAWKTSSPLCLVVAMMV